MIQALSMTLLTVGLVCDVSALRADSLGAFLVAGTAIVALAIWSPGPRDGEAD